MVEHLEWIGLVFTALAGLITAVALSVKISTRRWEKSDQERQQLSAKYEGELRRDIDAERADNQKLRQRVTDLEAERVKDRAEVDRFQSQLNTVLAEMATLQGQVKALETKLQTAEHENGGLRKENDQLRHDLANTKQAELLLRHEAQILRDALALVGGERAAKSAPEPAKEPSEHADSAPVVEGTTA